MLAAACLGVLAGPVSMAQAAVTPPQVTIQVGTPAIQVGDLTHLTITVNNLDPATTLNNIGVVITLPSGLKVSTAAPQCNDGTVSATSSNPNITLSGLHLVVGGSCSFGVNVQATSTGTKTITTNAPTSTESPPGTPASAQVFVLVPPTIATVFGAPSIAVGSSTTATFTIGNPNGLDIGGAAFTDSLPTGLIVATPNGASTTCTGGTVTAAAGSSSIALSGGTVTANSNCTVTVSVTPTAGGTLTNTTGQITTTTPSLSGSTASASLLAIQAPTLATAFAPGTVKVGTSSTETFTISNPNASTALSGVGFSDPLPAGLTVATPSGLTGTCGGGTITAAAGSSSISLSGAALAANGSCSFSVNVVGSTAGALTNTTGAINSNESGSAGTASAALNVVGPPAISLGYADASMAVNGTTTMTLTITNPASNPITLHGVGVSDTLPAGLKVATPNNLGGTCPGGTVTATAGSSTVSVSGATIAPGATCTVLVDVLATTVGTLSNTTGNVTSTEGGNGSTANASVVVALAPALHISFTPSSIAVGQNSTISYTVNNTNNVALNGIAFTDTLPAGLQVATGGLAGTCGGGTITAVDGTSQVDLSGATLPASGSCTFTVVVTPSAYGSLLNTTSQISSSNGGKGPAASATLTVSAIAPTVTLAYGAPSIAVNAKTTMTLTITNPAGNPAPIHGVAISDTLPAGLKVATPNNLGGTCPSATVTATAGSSAVTVTGGVLAPSATCTVVIDVLATSVGTLSNTTGTVSSTESGNGTTATASIVVALAPSLTMTFTPSSIAVGQNSTIAYTVSNTNNVALNGIAFTDALPAGLQIATGGLSGTCGGGTITAVDGTGQVNLSGATLPASGSCTFSVVVTPSAYGPLVNTTSQVSSSNGGNGSAATATLTVKALAPIVTLAYAAPSMAVNGTTTMTLTITNPAGNPATIHGVAVSDTLPAGLKVATPNNLGGTCPSATVSATAGSSSVTVTGGVLAPNATCTVQVDVLATTVGTLNNTTGNVTSTESGNGTTASASIVVAVAPSLQLTFTPGSITIGQTSSLSFKVSNTNNVALNGIAFTDTLPAGLQVATGGLSGTCGGGTITAVDGTSQVNLSGATLAAAGSCTFTVTVTPSAYGPLVDTTSQVSSSNGGNGSAATATLTVKALAPTIALDYASPTVAVNTATAMTLTITNPAGNPAIIHGVAVSDTLPAGLKVATPNNLGGSCPGATISAVAGSSTISISNAAIAPGGTCTVAVDVLATTVGTLTNTTGNVTSTESGNGGTASGSVVVAVAPTLHIAYTPASIAAGGTSTLSYTVANPNSASLTGIAFTDPLPVGLSIVAGSQTGTCGGGTITAVDNTGQVNLSGATLAAHASCTFSVGVITFTLGNATNTTSVVTSSNGGNGSAASAALLVLQAPTVDLNFVASTLAQGQPTSATFTIHNPNPSTALTGVGITDTLPGGLVVASPTGATSSCGGTITASPGGSTITLSGATTAANGSCTFSVKVTGTTPGVKANTTGAVTSNQTGPGATGNDSVTVVAPPSIGMAYGTGVLVTGATTSLTFTISAPQNNPAVLTNVSFSDNLPDGLVISNPANFFGGCGGSTFTAVPGTQTITQTGAQIVPGSQCTFSISVTATGSGPQDNTTSVITSTEGGSGNSASASLDIPQPPVLAMTFGDPSVAINGTTTLSFTLSNPNPVALTGVAFNDTVPTGLVLVTLKALTKACSGSVNIGANVVALKDAKLAANASCTFSVLVTGASLGIKTNTSGAPSSVEGGTGNKVTASVNVVVPPVTPPPSTTPAGGSGTTTPGGSGSTTKTTNTAKCVVPSLRGKTLTQAKKLLSKAHCKLGKVSHKKVKKAKRGRVTAQAIKARTKRSANTKISITIAR